jgi:hypothetical protein
MIHDPRSHCDLPPFRARLNLPCQGCLSAALAPSGVIASVRIERAPDGTHLGFGTVTFEQESSVERAIFLANGMVLLGQALTVTRFIPAQDAVGVASSSLSSPSSPPSSIVPGAPIAEVAAAIIPVPPGPPPATLVLDLQNEYDRVANTVDAARVLVTIQAPRQPEQARVPMNLVLCVDISGSMSSSMQLLRQTLTYVVGQMTPQDHLGIITFESRVAVLAPLQAMTPGNKTATLHAIETLRDLGSTFLSGGLFKSCADLATLLYSDQGDRPAQASAVFLLTDGQATNGLTTADELVAVLRARTFIDTGYHTNDSFRGVASPTGKQAPDLPDLPGSTFIIFSMDDVRYIAPFFFFFLLCALLIG